MNKQAIQALGWIRASDGSDFNIGYVLGYINAITFDIEPWERKYLEVIANRVLWAKESA